MRHIAKRERRNQATALIFTAYTIVSFIAFRAVGIDQMVASIYAGFVGALASGSLEVLLEALAKIAWRI